ncbi:hypothetical protein Emed_002801 [Eimeria media]
MTQNTSRQRQQQQQQQLLLLLLLLLCRKGHTAKRKASASSFQWDILAWQQQQHQLPLLLSAAALAATCMHAAFTWLCCFKGRLLQQLQQQPLWLMHVRCVYTATRGISWLCVFKRLCIQTSVCVYAVSFLSFPVSAAAAAAAAAAALGAVAAASAAAAAAVGAWGLLSFYLCALFRLIEVSPPPRMLPLRAAAVLLRRLSIDDCLSCPTGVQTLHRSTQVFPRSKSSSINAGAALAARRKPHSVTLLRPACLPPSPQEEGAPRRGAWGTPWGAPFEPLSGFCQLLLRETLPLLALLGGRGAHSEASTGGTMNIMETRMCSSSSSSSSKSSKSGSSESSSSSKSSSSGGPPAAGGQHALRHSVSFQASASLLLISRVFLLLQHCCSNTL